MNLSNFFKAGPSCNPVNPKPITFTCVAKGETLPSGEKNPSGRPVRAAVTAAMVFLDADEVLDARSDAREALRERAARKAGDDKMPAPVDDGDLDIEIMYQMLQRALREWDPSTKRCGDPIFPSVDNARELLVIREANRVYTAHSRYVAEEHPEEAPSEATFSTAEKAGRRVAR